MTENQNIGERTVRNSALTQNQHIEQNQLSPEIPKRLISLPSSGMVYQQGHPLHGKDAVEVRDMTVRDEDILTSIPLIKNGTMTSTLIRACLIDKQIDPRSLIVGDRNAIVTALRITAYGRFYQTKVVCPACDKEQDFNFDMAALPMRTLPEQLGLVSGDEEEFDNADYFQEQSNTNKPPTLRQVSQFTNAFEYTTPTGLNVVFRFLTGEDEERMVQEKEMREKQGLLSENSITNSLMASILSINGTTEKRALTRYIPNMRAIDSLAIGEHISENQPDVILKQNMICNKCKNVEEVNIPMGVGFLWPRIKR